MSEVSLTPTPETKRLISKLVNKSPQVVVKAKVAGLRRATDLFRGKAVEEAPHQKGTLWKSIKTKVASNGDSGEIYSKLDYAKWQDEGTGIYGPNRAPIRPKNAKTLRFKNKAGKWVFARQVKGVKPKNFMKKAKVFLQSKLQEIDKIVYDELKKGLS